MEELDLQLNMALLVRRAKKFLLKTGKKFIGGQTKTRMGVDMSKVKCYNCGIYGHFARDCRKPKMERSDRDNNSRGNNSRPQNNASNAASNSSARSNISGAIVSQAFIAEIVNEEVYEEVVEETSIEELAVVAEVIGEELDSGNIEKFRDSSEVMNFCISSQRLKESAEEMFGIGYTKVPPPVNHNYTSMPSIDPELANFVPMTPLTVEPQSESESEPDEVTDSDQSKKSGISKKNESKPKSRGKTKKTLKNIPKTEFVKGEDFVKEEVKIKTGSNSQFVNQVLKNSNNGSSSSTDHEERPKNAAKIRKCYKCRGKGHLAADCPDDRGKSLVDPAQRRPFVDKPQNESVNVEKINGSRGETRCY
ncbi:uncharacterized protein LOC110881572 [Helianthus annuus]|uniref:uncharacterized protein LOC110881572 n=1 Tax=Helianthus annuus TaxID=4232 RepID=UPI000B8F5D57|nr:uncharacterized protein LOC110881572 [Helianthus annuus]